MKKISIVTVIIISVSILQNNVIPYAIRKITIKNCLNKNVKCTADYGAGVEPKTVNVKKMKSIIMYDGHNGYYVYGLICGDSDNNSDNLNIGPGSGVDSSLLDIKIIIKDGTDTKGWSPILGIGENCPKSAQEVRRSTHDK
ncbi:MAG TPA: hypothetical protein VJ201_01430 [Candidatus Babeliales bacterium]|nr:hypothetical protein [Candidatus Babeliales bacterium]